MAWVEIDQSTTSGVWVCQPFNGALADPPIEPGNCQSRFFEISTVEEAKRVACNLDPGPGVSWVANCNAPVLFADWEPIGGGGGGETGTEEPTTSNYLLPPLAIADAEAIGAAMLGVFVVAWGVGQILRQFGLKS